MGLDSGASIVLAMNIPGTVYSWPLSVEKCNCQRSSSPGRRMNRLHRLGIAALPRAVVHDCYARMQRPHHNRGV